MQRLKEITRRYAWILLVLFCGIGIVFPSVGGIALACMLAPVAGAFFNGRSWCGNFCPRGSFNERILARWSRKKALPPILPSMGFKVTFLVLLMSAFALQLYGAWGNWNEVGGVFVRMILLTTAITIALGLVFHHRAWCRICPMGTLARLVADLPRSKGRSKHVHFGDSCIDCKVCSRHCPIGIDVQSHRKAGKVEHPDCLKCRVCVEKCPRKTLRIA